MIKTRWRARSDDVNDLDAGTRKKYEDGETQPVVLSAARSPEDYRYEEPLLVNAVDAAAKW